LRADRDDELALELQIGGAGRVRHPGAVADDGVGGLLEEERVVALVALLHLPDVVDVVAPDAVHAPHGEPVRGARDRHRDGRRVEQQGHGASDPAGAVVLNVAGRSSSASSAPTTEKPAICTSPAPTQSRAPTKRLKT